MHPLSPTALHLLYPLKHLMFNSNDMRTGKEKYGLEQTIQKGGNCEIWFKTCFSNFNQNMGKRWLEKFGNTWFPAISLYCGIWNSLPSLLCHIWGSKQVLVSLETHDFEYARLDSYYTTNKSPESEFCLAHKGLGRGGCSSGYRCPNYMTKMGMRSPCQ